MPLSQTNTPRVEGRGVPCESTRSRSCARDEREEGLRPAGSTRRAIVRTTGYDPPMDRTFMFVGALMGLVGVGLGAFGAHGLRGRLSPEMLAIFETGVRYQMYHALALLAVAALMSRNEGRAMVVAGWSFTTGILIFSGSLYALALTGVTALGAITPIGGVALLVGWVALLVAAF